MKKCFRHYGFGKISDGDTELFRPINKNLLQQDPYLLLKNYQSYLDYQEQLHKLWSNKEEWTRKSILNIAGRENFLPPFS
ncbi:glycogen/starch/alpha-glucan phosphorylase [Autumnicola musiva]|uniref:glycogen/starch/alpha-glucan phosphorylase n=1 Tax=Autumnicola musiva TaxID=3075589 RepID=UPI003D77910F